MGGRLTPQIQELDGFGRTGKDQEALGQNYRCCVWQLSDKNDMYFLF